MRWIQALPNEDKEKLIAIDGKHLRGAASRGKQLHLVSAWDSNRSLLLGQVKAREKSNEITAIPQLLDSLVSFPKSSLEAAKEVKTLNELASHFAHYHCW